MKEDDKKRELLFVLLLESFLYLGFFGDALQSYTCSLVAPGKDAER